MSKLNPDDKELRNQCKQSEEGLKINNKKIFGHNFHIACLKENSTQFYYSPTMLKCEDIVTEITDAEYFDVSEDQDYERSDIEPASVFKSNIEENTLEYCAFYDDHDCEIRLYSVSLSDKRFQEGNLDEDEIYIMHYKRLSKENTDFWSPQTNCHHISTAFLIGTSAGGFLTLVIIGTITALVLINLRDKKEFERQLARIQANEAGLKDFYSPLYQEPPQDFKNLARRSLFNE